MGAADYQRERARLLQAASWNAWASRLEANAAGARVAAARAHRAAQARLLTLRWMRRAVTPAAA